MDISPIVLRQTSCTALVFKNKFKFILLRRLTLQILNIGPSVCCDHIVTELVHQILPICFSRGDDPLITGAIGCWQRLGGAQLPSHPASHSQRNWDNPICEATFANILSSSDAVGRARLLASTSNGSGQWLHALPSSALGLRLTDEETRIAVGLRVGADLVFPHKCICGSQVSSNGHHGLSCKKSSGRFLRHSLANDIIARSFRSADTPVTLEPTGMLRSDGKRPDGVTMIPWSRGRTLVWDFTCPDTVAPSRVHQTSLATGVAASDAESKKSAKYAELQQNHIFVPFAVETLGLGAPVLGLCPLRLGLGFPGRRGTHGQRRSFVRTLTSRSNGATPPPFWAPFTDVSVTILTVGILICNPFIFYIFNSDSCYRYESID